MRVGVFLGVNSVNAPGVMLLTGSNDLKGRINQLSGGENCENSARFPKLGVLSEWVRKGGGLQGR